MQSMRLILALPVWTMMLYHHQVSAGSAILTNNVFNNVAVSIAGIDTYEDSHTIDSFITTLQDLLQNTSQVMYAATGNRLSFGTIAIVLLANWENHDSAQSIRNVRSSNIMYIPQTSNTTDILIDITNAAYGFMPYTQQSGFCGERGDFIHITYNFIAGNYDRGKYGSPSSLLAREWIKYYFGVYDEQGYNYDYMYPVKYFSPEAVPVLNLCATTNPSWSSYVCDNKSMVLGLPLACDLVAEPSYYINTSMMSLPLTPVASQFCSEGNHNPDAPNKHNIMCDGKSVMEVVFQNSQVIKSGNFKFAKANIKVEQLSSVNTLAAAVFWDNMDLDTTRYSSLPSLSKFIQYDLPQNSWISFQESIKENLTLSWTQITSDEDRTDVLNTIAEAATEINDMNLFKSFENLIMSAANMSNNIKLLLFVSSSDISSDNWSYMCEMAVENKFQMRVISYSAASVIQFMANSNNCPGKAIQISTACPPNCQRSQFASCCTFLGERMQFDEFSRAIPNSVAPHLYGPPQTFYETVTCHGLQIYFGDTYTSNITDNYLTERIYYETCENMNLSTSEKPSCQTDFAVHKGLNCSLDSNATLTYCADQTLTTISYLDIRQIPPFNTNIICVGVNLSFFFSKYLNLNYIQSYGEPGFICTQPGMAPYSIYVVGQPINAISNPNIPAVNLYAWTVVDYPFSSFLNASIYRIRIFARFVIGTTPIINAVVRATAVSNNQILTISLRDDGSGNPDVSVNDSIYSAYLTTEYFNDILTINVSAEGYWYPQTCYPNSSYPWISGLPSMDTIVIYADRIVSAGTVYPDPSKHTYPSANLPPGRIMDLHVFGSSDSAVWLQWTTPGLNTDFELDGFYLKCSTDKFDLNATRFHPTNDLFYPDQFFPGSINQQMIYEDDDQTHYCSIITCNIWDQQMICSEPSNIATYNVLDRNNGNNDRRHHNIVLWCSIAAGIVLLLIVSVVLGIALCTGSFAFISNLFPKTPTTIHPASEEMPSPDNTSVPMELNDMANTNGVTQTQLLDQPPSYEDTLINYPAKTNNDQSM